MRTVLVIARKEFRDAWREKLIVILLACLALLVVVSIVSATQRIGVDVQAYNQAVAALQASGQISMLTPPSFAPLQMLRSSIEYLEIIGAVLAITLGYVSIARERTGKTMKLVLSRSVSRASFIGGKLLGNLAIIATIVAGFCLFAYTSIWLIGGLQLTGIEVLKLCIAGLLSLLYLTIFYCLAAILTMHTKFLATAFIIALVFWVGFVLILPQIGDTMDVDNQVPGGFFASLNLPKQAEKSVLTHFTSYEAFRNGAEISSPTKHYERASFAILGIKNIYNGRPLPEIWRDTWGNSVTLATVASVMIGLLYISFIKNKELLR